MTGCASASATVEFSVPFYDCDPLFIVWHGRYFQYLELARTALLKQLDLDIPVIRALGMRMFITDVRCRYLFPLGYDDRVSVTAHFVALRPRIRVAYDVRNVTQGRKSARAITELATTDADGNLFHETPDEIISRITR